MLQKINNKKKKLWQENVHPSSGRGESCVSGLPVARPNTKSAPTMH
jgi:hypothetical protein